MTLKVLLFALYREQAGTTDVELELPTEATVREAAAALELQFPELKLKGALAAIDEDYASPDTPLQAGATLAFFPPVAGGSGEGLEHFFVTEGVLELEHYLQLASAPRYGALSTFSGTVRSPNSGQDVRFIEYQGYEAMILSQMSRVANELRERFDVGHIVFAHRLGKLLPGEASIVIVVSSAHRRDALLATHVAIDRLKEVLPVWKLEVTLDGSHWVEGSVAATEPL